MVDQASISEPSRRRRLGQVCGRLWRAADKTSLLWLSAALVIVSLGGVLASLAPLALKTVIDLLGAGGSPVPTTRIGAYIGLYVAALLVQRLCEQAQAFAYSTGEQRLIRRFGGQSFAHMLTLPLGFHLDAKSGALAQSLSEGLIGIRLILTHLALSVAPVIVQIAVASLVLGSLFGGSMGFALLAALTAYTTVFALGLSRIHTAMRGISAAQIDVGGATADSLMNVEAIKAYTAERRFARRYDDLLGRTEGRWRLFLRRRLENGLAVAAVFGFALGAVLWLASGKVAGGAMSVGAFVMINTYVLQLVRPLEMLGFAIRDIGQGLAYLDKLMGVLEHPPENPTLLVDKQGRALPEGPADLEFDEVSFAFAERPTLSAVSFRARPGMTIGIVGPSGAGKSSLLRLVLRFFEPSSGEIRLDGQSLSDLPLETVRRQIALVSQDTILFNDTIGENIALAAEDAGPDAIAAAAALARLSDLLAVLPDGLDTRVGERGLKLSGGEKQRVSIARAALKQARLVIFDEATAALDPETERAVWQAMAGLSQGATTLVVTHRLSTVVSADEILVLDHGAIVERGDHAHLLAMGGLYARLWQAQSTGAFRTPSLAVSAANAP